MIKSTEPAPVPLSPLAAAAEPGPARVTQRLLVYQSLWAMEQRRPDGFEWSLERKLEMIRAAGFDGAGVRFFDRDHARQVTGKLREWGLSWQAQCYPRTVDDLKPILEHVAEFGADHLNLQADVRPHTVAECVPLIEGWQRLADDAGVALHFETHRDRMTTDLYFTLRLLDRFPHLRLTGDLSHYVVGREFAWPISEENHRLMHRVIDQCWGFHGRVASREQIQVQISFAHQREWLDLFMSWWQYGFRSWRKRAPLDATLTFLCELGPKEYAMTGRDGYELSDRWQEAQMLMQLVRNLWRRLEQEDAAPAAAT
jgi:hypothetical protein